MAAKMYGRKDRPGWYVVKHRNGRKSWKRYGDTPAAKRQAERDAREFNRKLQRGALGLEPPPKPKPVPFGSFADHWYKATCRTCGPGCSPSSTRRLSDRSRAAPPRSCW